MIRTVCKGSKLSEKTFKGFQNINSDTLECFWLPPKSIYVSIYDDQTVTYSQLTRKNFGDLI